MKYQYLLFDLDGTLTDSKEGIMKSVKYTLDFYGIEVKNMDELTVFIGPPLHETFQNYCGFDSGKAREAVAKYRERFSTVGLFENRVYEGIEPLLHALKTAGRTLAVATSKPEVYSVRILEKFGIAGYFDVIAGSNLDGTREKKEEVIEEAIRRLGLTEADRKQTVMIGDRRHDMEGAAACGVDAIGVYYGYADPGELEAYGAAQVVQSVEELGRALLKS